MVNLSQNHDMHTQKKIKNVSTAVDIEEFICIILVRLIKQTEMKFDIKLRFDLKPYIKIHNLLEHI